MEYKDLYPTEDMILEQKARLREKYDTTRADLVNMLLDARRTIDAQGRLIVSLEDELAELEDAFAELTDDYNTLEDQFIRIGGAEDPAMRG